MKEPENYGEEYQIDGYEIWFHPWYSDYMEESFMAVSVFDPRDVEIFHAGMTKMQPSEEKAKEVLDFVLMYLEDL